MISLIVDNLDLDGSVSTSDQYSEFLNLEGKVTPIKAAFVFDATVESGSDPTGIMLQVCIDPDGAASGDWMDVRDTSIKIIDSDTGVALSQNHSLLDTPATGVLDSTGSYYLEWDAFPGLYRLKFEVLAGTDIDIGTVPADPLDDKRDLVIDSGIGTEAVRELHDLVSFKATSATCIRIDLPDPTDSGDDLTLDIIGYAYTAGRSAWRVIASGYYSSTSWSVTSAVIIGDAPFEIVRFGHLNTGGACIFLGDTGGNISYPAVAVKIALDSDAPTLTRTGWAISDHTSDTGYTIDFDTSSYKFLKEAELVLKASISIDSPTGSEDKTIFVAQKNITVVRVDTVLVGGGSAPSVDFNIHYSNDRSAAGTTLWSSDETCDSTTYSDSFTAFGNDSISAGDFVWIETSSVTDSPDEFHVTVRYQYA